MISVMKASQLFTSITIVLSLTVAHTQAAETFLITKGTDGLASNSSSTTPSINGDGSKIVFASGASNLIAPTPQGSSNIYLYDANDTSINKIRLISKSMIDGKSGNNFSRQPSIDSTGRYITFQSSANNLVPNDTSLTDIFLYDLQTDELVNISYGGNNNSWNPQVSGNGAYVIFESLATNLVSGDTNGKTDVFAYDIANRALKNITKQGVNESFLTSISYNGQFITFTSLASEFVSVDKNPSYDIFIYDQVANTYEIVNIDENGNQDFGLSLSPDVSRDGRFVTFLSYSNTLVQGDTNGLVDVYLRDRKNNTTTRVTKNLITNAESDSPTFRPQISDDGRFIVYMSRATTLVAGNPDGKAQVFVFDRLLKTTEIASVKLDGTPSTGDVEYFTSLNSDGSMIAFSSNATDLVTNVGNSLVDIYLRVRDPILDLTPNAVAGADQVLQCSAGGATVSLNGSASSDPEEQELSYQWTNSTTVVTGKFAQMDLPVGTHTIELRVTDPKGNSATDTLVVQVNDSVAPSLQVNELSVTLEAQRVEGALYTPSYTTSDNCSKVSVLVNPTPNYYPLGKTVVTLSAQDQSGNLSTGTIDVVVRDTTKPVLTIPADIIEEAKAKKTMVTLGKATATDIFPVTVSNDAPVTGFGLGETLVNWSAVDSNNNKAVATQRVTIRDTLAPVINAGPDITLEATVKEGASYSFNYTLSDQCDCGTVEVVANPIFNYYPLGTTTVTLTAKDISGNESADTVNITVVDTTLPTIAAPDDILAEAQGKLTSVDLGTAKTSDIFDVTVLNNAPTAFPLGKTIVEWLAKDANGNIATDTQVITVKDSTAPLIDGPADLIVEASDKYTITTLTPPKVTELFGVTIVNDAPVSGFPLGDTIVTWTATDESGNIGTAKQLVRVVDTTSPVIAASKDVLVEASDILTPISLPAVSASDLFLSSVTSNAPSSYALGTTIVVWTAIDSSGNKTTANQNVIVRDTTAPVLSLPQDLVVEASANLTPIVVGGATASDIFTPVSLSHNAPAAFPLGVTQVTWTATDTSGNVSTGIQKVTVIDTTAPVLSLPQDLVVEASAALTPVLLADATASDIFTPVSLSHNAPAAFPLGVTQVTWTAIDANGNTSTGIQKVTVIDTTAPSFVLSLERIKHWPPHHKMVHVATLKQLSDYVDSAPVVDITVVSNSNHKRRHKKDDELWEVVKSGNEWKVYVRIHKRIKDKNDLIYTITANVKDFSGNANTQTVDVRVGHDKHHEKKEHHNKKENKKNHKHGE